ncbi:MAG: hypothetical protein HY898_36145 [Deltaproteobacteria bacterium]|nr:hypothetical protein [Deltaproteobacteria bacterium]
MSGYRLSRIFASGLVGAVVSALVLTSASARAQDDEPKGESKSETKSEAKGEAKTDGSVSLSTKGKALSSTTEADSDHAMYVGAFAVGYLGAADIPFVNAASVAYPQNGGVLTMTAEPAVVNAPVIGMRYWLSDLIGIDAGFGLATYSASVTQHYAVLNGQSAGYETDVKTTAPSSLGMLLHAGVPLALHAEKHWVFEVIPEINFGFSSGTRKYEAGFVDPAAQPPILRNDVKLSGMRFDIGARVGTEIHFGFIGVPNLALQAGVGLYLQMLSFKAKGGGNPDPNGATPDTSYSGSSTTISTSVLDSPWSIFTKSVAALYYF